MHGLEDLHPLAEGEIALVQPEHDDLLAGTGPRAAGVVGGEGAGGAQTLAARRSRCFRSAPRVAGRAGRDTAQGGGHLLEFMHVGDEHGVPQRLYLAVVEGQQHQPGMHPIDLGGIVGGDHASQPRHGPFAQPGHLALELGELRTVKGLDGGDELIGAGGGAHLVALVFLIDSRADQQCKQERGDQAAADIVAVGGAHHRARCGSLHCRRRDQSQMFSHSTIPGSMRFSRRASQAEAASARRMSACPRSVWRCSRRNHSRSDGTR